MSIWIKNEKGETVLAPYSYEKTLVGLNNLVVWIEGTNTDLSFSTDHNGFGIAGGPVWTNYGVKFTKEHLKELVKKMKDGAELLVCYPDQYVSTNRKRYGSEPTIEERFAEYNSLIQVTANGFAPYTMVAQLLEEGKVAPEYIESSKKKLAKILKDVNLTKRNE